MDYGEKGGIADCFLLGINTFVLRNAKQQNVVARALEYAGGKFSSPPQPMFEFTFRASFHFTVICPNFQV